LDTIDYDKMIQNALRSVVRCALKQVAEHGLPGQHHFYITFRTDRRDVEMPEHVRNEHPNEVTIVMQHQFWNLEVEEDYFSITLSFNSKRERLKIPFGALISFMDPSVKFGLQFTPEEPALEHQLNKDKKESALKSLQKTNIVTLDAFRKKKK